MPFTPAHIAAVLPLRRWFTGYFSFTALVIGSIVPDMEYFLRFNPASGFSHTLRGVFLFDLPLSLFFIYLWNLYIQQSVVKYFPRIRIVIKEDNIVSAMPVHSLKIILSALIGIGTHLLWDGFTHGKGFFIQHIDLLSKEVLIGTLNIKVCYLLWYISSFAGSLIVAFYFFKLNPPGISSDSSSDKSDFWAKTWFLMIMISVIRISMGLSHNVPRHLVIILMGAFIYSYLLIAFSNFIAEKKNIVNSQR